MYRITVKDLENGLTRLNKISGAPATPYTKQADGTFTANGGNYHLSGAYGGYMVMQMLDTGGCRCPITCGHVSKRECFDTLHAYINGYEAATV